MIQVISEKDTFGSDSEVRVWLLVLLSHPTRVLFRSIHWPRYVHCGYQNLTNAALSCLPYGFAQGGEEVSGAFRKLDLCVRAQSRGIRKSASSQLNPRLGWSTLYSMCTWALVFCF